MQNCSIKEELTDNVDMSTENGYELKQYWYDEKKNNVLNVRTNIRLKRDHIFYIS